MIFFARPLAPAPSNTARININLRCMQTLDSNIFQRSHPAPEKTTAPLTPETIGIPDSTKRTLDEFQPVSTEPTERSQTNYINVSMQNMQLTVTEADLLQLFHVIGDVHNTSILPHPNGDPTC